MQRLLTLICFHSPLMIVGGQTLPVPDPPKKMQAMALLPDGSELKEVMLPRYDEKRQLVGVLKAKTLTLVSAGKIAGKTVAIEFFNPDQSGRGRIDLTTALFDQEKGFLTAIEPVEIKSDRMSAQGTSLYYSFDQGEGFLRGPATTTLQAPPKTAMKTPSTPLRATAFLGASLMTQSLIAAPPPSITAQEKAALQQDAISKAPAAAAATEAVLVTLNQNLADADRAAIAARAFIATAAVPSPPAAPEPAAAATKPLEVNPGADDTVIECKGGMYFDADEGMLVYMKDVTVKDPRFNLSGANELKVFFGKKPPKPIKVTKPSEPPQTAPLPSDQPVKPKTPEKTGFGGGIGNNFGDVERIVATGAVLIEQKGAAGKEPIKASGAIFSYQIKADQIIIKGGYPWFTQGATFMRAMEPDLILRLSPKTGGLVTEGNWQMGGNLEQKK